MISVVIPIRNAESSVKKSITSVLDQEIKDLEVLCVINGTSDNTEETIKSISDDRVKILHSDPGIVPALNAGIRAAKGDFIARQDADDIWLPTKLVKQINFLKNNSNIDILGTQLKIVDGKGTFLRNSHYPTENDQICSSVLSGVNAIGHPSVLYRRKVLDKCAGYFDLFPFAEDMDLWLRAMPWFRFANLNEELVIYQHIPNPNYNPEVPKILSSWYRTIYGVK